MAEDIEPQGRDSDAAQDAALRRLLSQTPLSAAALQRVQDNVEREWRATWQQRRQRIRSAWAAALVACLVLAALLVWRGPQFWRTQTVFGQFAGEALALEVQRPGWFSRPGASTVLHVGDTVRARANTAIELRGGGWLRLRQGATVAVARRNELWLERGTAYVDLDSERFAGRLAVLTAYGRVEHLGTQFEATVESGQLRLRVREGTVRLTGLVEVQAMAGEELRLAGNGKLQRAYLAPYDAAWNWVQEPPTTLEVEGQSLLRLLRWVARESGRRLEFADAQVEQIADRSILHGSIRGLSPELALRAMLATTSLSAELRADSVVVAPGR